MVIHKFKFSRLDDCFRSDGLYQPDSYGDFQDQKAEAFYTLTEMGVLTADKGYLRPKALVTRAEAVTLLQRLYEATSK